MSDPREGEPEVRNPRRPRIPADKDSVWEDGSGDEARSRRRDDAEGARLVTGEEAPAPEATRGNAGSSRPPITRSSGSAAKRKRKAARRLK